PSPTTPWIEPTVLETPQARHQSDRLESNAFATPWQSLPTNAPTPFKQDQCHAYELAKHNKKPTPTKCVGTYHHSLATTISGTSGTLGTPRAFIRREGTKLRAGSRYYRPVGPNIYWLGLDENDGRKVSYPSKNRVREAFAIAAAMGANTVRSLTLGVSTGHPLSVWPSKGETNDDAFEPIDYAIGTARQYGIRLIIPLTDNYKFYHGGKYDFLRWEGINITDKDTQGEFYSNEDVMESFKDYIEVILTHVNQYTGIALKDDPTIMAWETGNELGAFQLKEKAPPGSWTSEIAGHIKNIDSNHLVVDGSDGLYDTSSQDIDGLKVDEIDIVSDHFYPINNYTFWQDHGRSMLAGKVLMIGEYDWTGSNGGMPLSTFYNQVLKTRNVGDIAWNVMTHDDKCCHFITHDDGYSIYYPNGNANLLQRRLLRLVQHWWHVTGRKSPHVLPAVAC
ncbi:hypothetical protein CROQUDRAFT_17297, partial [Cronartium quercuum f. sp. fusiforme G11]